VQNDGGGRRAKGGRAVRSGGSNGRERRGSVLGFWVRPLTLVHPRGTPLSSHRPPPLPPPPPPLLLSDPHEVWKGCCARGARMWNTRSAHSVTPAYRGLPLLGACTLMRYVRPTDRPLPPTLRRRPHPRAPPCRPFIPALPAPYFSLLHPSRPSSVSFSACNGPVVSSRERLRYRTRCSLRDLVSPIASRMNSHRAKRRCAVMRVTFPASRLFALTERGNNGYFYLRELPFT